MYDFGGSAIRSESVMGDRHFENITHPEKSLGNCDHLLRLDVSSYCSATVVAIRYTGSNSMISKFAKKRK
jgi:hypothetical protein